MGRKNSFIVGLLTLISLGFYGIHWFGEQREFIEGKGGSVPSAWLFGIVVFLLPLDIIASLWVQSKYIEQAQMLSQYFMWAGLAIAIISALLYMRWASQYNQSLDVATAGSVTSKLSILPFGLGFLGFWSLQTAVNKYHFDSFPAQANQPVAPDSQQVSAVPIPDGSNWQAGLNTVAEPQNQMPELDPVQPTYQPPLSNQPATPPTSQPAVPQQPVYSVPQPGEVITGNNTNQQNPPYDTGNV